MPIIAIPRVSASSGTGITTTQLAAIDNNTARLDAAITNGFRPPAWTPTNTSQAVMWETANGEYELHSRKGAILTTKNPADDDAIANWLLAMGLYTHDSLAAHLYAENLRITSRLTGDIYVVLAGATIAQLRADPAESAGYGFKNS